MLHIEPSGLKGSLSLPPSKSHTLRAIVFALLARGRSVIRHPLLSPDAQAMIRAIEQFGARVFSFPDRLEIDGVGLELKSPEDVINAGNSGIVLRFIGALSALLPTYTILTGDASIRHSRPILPLLEGVRRLGVFAESALGNDQAPVIIKGPMHPGTTYLCGEDSQPVSALLITTALLQGTTIIHVRNPGEKPWIDLTLHWLKRFGIEVQCDNHKTYTVPGYASIPPFDITIPGDFSTASYPIVAALLTNSPLEIQNVDFSDVQGDKRVVDLLIEMGANISIEAKNKTLYIHPGSRLKAAQIDINDYIDALPLFAVIGCFADGKTEVINGAIARKKESDRISAIVKELKKMGAKIEEKPDGFIVENSQLHGSILSSHADHRIALSLSVAALAAHGNSVIEGHSCIAKSYPTFVEDFKNLGAALS